MAKIGFEYIVAAKLDTEASVSKATAKYTEARVLVRQQMQTLLLTPAM